MKKLLLLFIIYYSYADNVAQEKTDFEQITNYINSHGYDYINKMDALKYAGMIIGKSEKYNLNPHFVARLVNTESRYKKTAGNRIAYGLMGIRPVFWSNDLRRMFPYLNLKNRYKVIKYIKNPYHGLELGCFILSNYIDDNNGDYSKGALQYWAGRNSSHFRYAKRNKQYFLTNKYIKEIMGNVD